MQKKSIYTYAAEAGVPAGLYLTLMSACFLLSVRIPALPMFMLPLAAGFPVVLWMLLRKICIEQPSYRKLSSLWLAGIYTVIFGTMVCLLLSGLYITFFEPGFVGLYIQNAIDVLQASPVSADYGASIEILKEMAEAHLLPSSMEFLLTISWFTCFMGSVLSLVIALLMTRNSRKAIDRASI